MPDPESPPLHFDEFTPVSPDAWREYVRSDLGGTSPEDFLTWDSGEGVSISAYLTPQALRDALHTDRNVSIPPLAETEDAPANDWAVCQPIQHPDPDTANQHARAAVSGGAEALEVGALPREPDDTDAHSHPHPVLGRILDGIAPSDTALHFGPGPRGLVLYSCLSSVLSDRDLTPETIAGSVLYDPVAAVASGASPDRAFPLADNVLADTADMPHFRPVTVDTSVYHDAGASAVQELAYALGALTERLTHSTERGEGLPRLQDALQVRLPISTSYFVEMAKLRALRLLVPQVVDAFVYEAGGTADIGPADVSIYATTSRRTETLYDPYVNMLRATTEAMAAVLGGCDVLALRPYDAALRPPEDFGLRIARNTQLLLEHEAHLDQVADPAAGSYYVEALTDRLAQNAWAQFQRLEADGGLLEALRAGTLQDQIAATRQDRREALDTREQILVGTTHYPSLDEERRDDQAASVPSSTTRDASFSRTLSSVDTLRSALRDGAAPSELAPVLQSGPSDIAPLPRIRLAEEIESIRLRTEAFAEAHGGPPLVLLAPLGPPAARSARATFARNFLGVAGFAVEEPLKFESVDAIADAAVEHHADIIVLCSSDAEYGDLAPALAAALGEQGHDALLGIAGAPDNIDVDQADFFVHQGSDVQETLTTLQDRLGIDVTSDP
jgi:methylmalonyl-CoA mutase